MSTVKICVSVIYCLCVYTSLGDAALATIRVLKISCYCSQNAVLQIAQNGLGLTGFSHAGGPEFPPSCGSGPLGLWAAGCGAAAKHVPPPAVGGEVAAAPAVS